MGKYSHTSLIGKMLIYPNVLQALSFDGLLFGKAVNVLYLAQRMNKKRTSVTALTLCFILKANKKTTAIEDCHIILDELTRLEYLRKGGGKGLTYFITEHGNAALAEIEHRLRRSIIKFKKNDPNTAKLPGPKKGAAMPNRWKEGEPKGRKPRSEGGK